MGSTYTFYDLLRVRLTAGGRGWNRYFDNEYARISAPSGAAGSTEPRVTIDVHVARRPPRPMPGDVRRTERFKGLFSFAYVVRGLDTDHVEIWFREHWLSRVYMNAIGVYLQAQVLEPIMYAKLLELDVLLMHAGGVASAEKGFLLPAYGGTGKTTLSMALMASGYRLIGDDLLFVELTTGIVHPYPRPLHIFTYNVRNLRGATVPLRYRTAVRTKNVLRFFLERLLRREFLISTRIHADELFPGPVFADPVPYASIAFLRKTGDAIESVPIDDGTVDALARGIAESEDLNDSLAQMLADDDRLPAILEREHSVIVRLLRQFDRLLYVNTRQMDLDAPDALVTELEAGGLRR